MADGQTWYLAEFVGGYDELSPLSGTKDARVTGLWIESKPDLYDARAGFWQWDESADVIRDIVLRPRTPYLFSFYYRTVTEEGRPTVWVSSDQDAFWAGDKLLPPTNGTWLRFVGVWWNPKNAPVAIQPLVRNWGEGAVWFDDIEIVRL